MGINGHLNGYLFGSLEGALGSADPDPVLPYYAQLEDLRQACGGEARLRQLFDRNQDGLIDMDFVESCLRSACGDIDSYAAKHFEVPFAVATPVIRLKTAQIARLHAESWRGLTGEDYERRHKAMYNAHVDEPGWLVQLGKGMVTPGASPMPPKHPTMAPDGVIEPAFRRETSRRALKGYW